ncbi:MAG: GntR family transcriptional regulator [Desulfobulbaceae bacterium]|nr:GntR family transcriptional regulator [Desulfobulbaceae bacterium]
MNTEIYQAIKKRIVFMEYEPGQLLDEKVLAKEFKVSRTPVREVLLRLQYEMLLEIIPRGGIFVKRIDFQEMRDVYLTRILIEGEVAKLATINITQEQLREIEKIKAECEEMINNSNPELLIRTDIALRDVMHRASKRPTIGMISNCLYYQTLRLWYLVFNKTSFSVEVEHQIKEIEITLTFLRSGDPATGESGGREIISNYMSRITKYFSSPE